MKKFSLLILILVFITIFVVYFITINYFYPEIGSGGEFGDLFGGLNTFFSGLAFGGIVYAILLQRKDLELQREELKLTREELKRTAEAQEKSERALSKQAESLKQTAILNGLGAILSYESMLIEVSNTGKYGNIPIANRSEAEKIKQKIEAIIKTKE